MDGVKARDLYSVVGVRIKFRWVGGRGGRCKIQGASPGGAVVGADFGGSSKYLNENFEGRRGERFYVNGICIWVSRF